MSNRVHYIYIWKESGVAYETLRSRIKNNIPFDLVPSKANRKGKDF